MSQNVKTRDISGFYVNKVTSRSNPAVIETAKLKDRKYRDTSGLFIFEGIKLFDEAISASVGIERVFITENNYESCVNFKLKDRVIPVSDEVYAKISEEKSPQGILTVAKHLDFLHKKVKIYNISNNSDSVFILSSIRDPGNLGTIIRSAFAFGIDELILSGDCADLYNSKTVRASMGALFRQRVTICENLSQAVKSLRTSGYKVYAAMLDKNALNVKNIKVDKSVCFVVGNEGHGIDPDIVPLCNAPVIIPIAEQSESLNAAGASAVLMWEIKRS